MTRPGSYAIFTHSLATVRHNLAVAMSISWPWMLVIFLLTGRVFWEIANQDVDPLADGDYFKPLDLITQIVQAVAMASLSVNWHRFVLLDEVASGWQRLRLDWPVWRYLGNYILAALFIMLAAGAIVFALSLLGFSTGLLSKKSEESPLSIILMIVFGITIVIFAMIFWMRLLVKLPAVALSRTDYRFGNALRDTKAANGTILGMVLLSMLLSMGFILVGSTIAFSAALISPTLGVILGVIGYMVFVWFMGLFGVSQLTTLYGVYAEGREV